MRLLVTSARGVQSVAAAVELWYAEVSTGWDVPVCVYEGMQFIEILVVSSAWTHWWPLHGS